MKIFDNIKGLFFKAHSSVELKEDCLKYLYYIEENRETFDIEKLAKKCSVNIGSVSVALDELAEYKYWDAKQNVLTREGRSYAIRIIRKHRLYEKYLSENSGFSPEDWHAQACKKEHYISDEEEAHIDNKLGYPMYDPHGDPIPSKDSKLMPFIGRALSKMKVNDVVRVTRLNDYPKAAFRQVYNLGIMPSSVFRIEDINDNSMVIFFQGEIIYMPEELYSLIWVVKASEQDLEQMTYQRLSSLDFGQEATIMAISPACKGVLRRRLLDLGFVRGTKISIDLQSPMDNPISYMLRGTSIALRKEQAKYILIRRD